MRDQPRTVGQRIGTIYNGIYRCLRLFLPFGAHASIAFSTALIGKETKTRYRLSEFFFAAELFTPFRLA